MLKRSAVIALLCAGMVGCGGDDEPSSPDGAATTSQESGAPADAREPDAAAKADARNMTSHLEACFVDSMDYANCDSAEELGETDLSFGAGPGQVEVTNASPTGYEIVARSRSGNTFRITKAEDGTLERTCEAEAAQGGCRDGSW